MNQLHSLQQLKDELLLSFEKYDTIGLVTHKNPDGDGLCCCLALQELLKQISSKQAAIILETSPPAIFAFLDVDDRIAVYDDAMEFDLIIIVDCQSPDRVGDCTPLLGRAEKIVVIDHHESSPKEESITAINLNSYIYNDPSFVSAGAIIYNALYEDFINLPSESLEYCAANLYITVLNDTNNFTNSNTNDDVFLLCSKLAQHNISPHSLLKKFSFSRTPSYYRFLGQTLATISTFDDDSILFFYSTQKMLSENNLKSEATSKMTDNLKGVSEQTEVIVYFREIGTDKYRLSLRSSFIDVNKIAAIYKGGGHKKASGCEIEGKLQDLYEQLLRHIRKQVPYKDQ